MVFEIIAGLCVACVGLFIKGAFQQTKIDELEDEKIAAETAIDLKVKARKSEHDAQVDEEIAIDNINPAEWRDRI